MASANNLVFHVYSESKPDNILPFIRAVHEQNLTFSSVTDMTTFAQELGLGVPKQWNVIPQLIGLIETEKRTLLLSETAKVITQVNTDIQVELIHYLLYTAWQSSKPGEFTRLWSYRQVVDFLWRYKKIEDISGMRHTMAEEINNQTATVFATVEGYEPSKVSFGPKSIRGVLLWLEALKPPVIVDNQFQRRHFCCPELMTLALGWVAQQTGGELEIDFLLTPERREALCKLCLLDMNDVDNVINWTLPKYPHLVEPGTSSGVYGRFLRFHRWPQIVDLQ